MNPIRYAISLFVGLVVSSAVLSLAASASHAACPWNLNGTWNFYQDNGFTVTFNITQTNEFLSGTGQYKNNGALVNGTIVNSTIGGDRFTFTMDWGGVYEGSVGAQGSMSGITHDLQGNGKTNWHEYYGKQATCLAAAPSPPGQSDFSKSLRTKLNEAFANSDTGAILLAHNRYRAKHCVPLLTWSTQLAAAAQAWANGCKPDPSGGFAHSQTPGENLYWSSPAGQSHGGDPVDYWYAEIKNYNFSSPGYSKPTGHFTQVIWRATSELGCAKATCGNADYWVCRYGPAGNVSGQFPANVPPVCK